MQFFSICVVLIMLYVNISPARETLFTISSSLPHASLGKNIDILEDERGSLTIEDVRSPQVTQRFFSSDQEEPGFGFTSSVYWARLSVKNLQQEPLNWFLEIGYPLLDHIDLYIPDDNGHYSVEKTGDRLPFSSRSIGYRNFIFELTEPPGGVRTYYLRFETSSSMNFPLEFWRKTAFFEKNITEMALLGFFYGAVFIMIVYNIFLYIGFLDKSYIYYVLFIASWGLSQLSLNGLAYEYLWPEWVWWANINIPFFIFASVLTANQFARSLLVTGTNVPFWDGVIKNENRIFAAGIILALLLPYAVTIRAAAGAAIITVLVLIITTIASIRKKVRAAYFFMGAWGLYFLGVILFAAKSFGVLPGNFITNWSIQIGTFALLIFFSIAVQDRINRERREKYLAQQAALQNEQKLVTTLRESERVLEEKVRERTAELSRKNVFLKKKTEELKALAEELDTLDNIVRVINKKHGFDQVINALLEQGLGLINQAEHGAALIYNPESDHYRFMAAVGYDLQMFADTILTGEEIKSAFGPLSEEVVKGIFIIRRNEKSDTAIISSLTRSKSILAMSISLEGELAGFLLFDNNSRSDAFDHSDARRLNRFRSHAISAFAKATLLLEMQKVTAEFIKTKDQLFVQEKLASLGQLTAGIAHEIKNPLNFVNNFAEGSVELARELEELLQKQKTFLPGEDFEELEEIINELKQNGTDILDNGKRADKIVRSMLDHARVDKGEKKSFDLNVLVDENINLAYHGYRALDPSFQVTVHKNLDASLPEVDAVQQDIGRVFLNILNNACYAVREKLRKMGEAYSPEISVTTQRGKRQVEIRIRDNGTGIPHQVREKIFNPFFTTKPTGEGNTGLGLSISYDIIVHQHHGKLEVESEPGKFTEFIVFLPLNDEIK